MLTLYLVLTILLLVTPIRTTARTIQQQQQQTTISSTTTSMATGLHDLKASNDSGVGCSANLDFLDDLRQKYPHQPTFLQAVEEMALSISSLFTDPEQGAFYQRAFLAMTEPERAISFRVPWEDDAGNMHYNRGWRVEFSRYVASC